MKQLKQFLIKTNLTTDLSYLGLIKVTGADAQQLLQGQFTNDISKVNTEQHQLSSLCSHKGRIIVNNVVGNNEVVRHNQTGYLFELSKEEEFQTVLQSLLMNKEKAR